MKFCGALVEVLVLSCTWLINDSKIPDFLKTFTVLETVDQCLLSLFITNYRCADLQIHEKETTVLYLIKVLL